ncbi:MAG: hypothetical protein AAGB11_00585 [Pseudomonadota bacterium]
MRLALAAAAMALTTVSGQAQLEPIDPSCAPLVGTFLTTKSEDANAENGQPGRSLIALTIGGQAFMSDSAQGGGGPFQGFTTARGAWICSGDEDGQLAFRAVMVDFTFPAEKLPVAMVVRVETVGTVDPETLLIEGGTTVSFFPLAGNPLGDDEPESSLKYTFSGQKVVVGKALQQN